jgi:hypothetical protein
MAAGKSTIRGALSDPDSLLSMNAALPWWVQTIILLGALLMAAGGLIALVHPAILAPPQVEINSAVHIYASYFAARNLVLAILLVVALRLRARGMLNSLMLLSGFIQALDAGIDCVEGRWIVAPGVIGLGLLFFVTAAALSGHPFWKMGGWRPGDSSAYTERT